LSKCLFTNQNVDVSWMKLGLKRNTFISKMKVSEAE
jgi:hypothetical protein